MRIACSSHHAVRFIGWWCTLRRSYRVQWLYTLQERAAVAVFSKRAVCEQLQDRVEAVLENGESRHVRGHALHDAGDAMQGATAFFASKRNRWLALGLRPQDDFAQ